MAKTIKKNQARGKVIYGNKLSYNAAIQFRYTRALLALVDKMTSETEKIIKDFYQGKPAKEFFAEDASVSSQARILTNNLTKHFDALFNREAPPLAGAMVDESNKASKSALSMSLKELSDSITISASSLTANAAMKDILSASVTENVNLIKSIPSQYLDQVNGAVMRSISVGNGLADLEPFLLKQKGITERRAKNMALDQTRKVYNGINKGRMLNIGVTRYEWLHSDGSQHPRQLHIDMNGNIYSLEDPPIIQYDPEVRGIPGQLINCKCTMRPIVKFNDGDDGDS